MKEGHEDVLRHLVECDGCRQLFAEFKLSNEFDIEEQNITNNIIDQLSIYINKDGLYDKKPIVLRSGNKQFHKAQNAISFNFLTKDNVLTGIISFDHGLISIHMQCNGNEDKKYYLVGNNIKIESTPQNGQVSFNNLPSGIYCLIENFKYFKILKIINI